jgi:DNA polymerase V
LATHLTHTSDTKKSTVEDGKKITAGVFRDSIKHDFRSPSYTTKWSEIPEAE